VPGFDAHASELMTEDICHAPVGAMIAETDSFDRSGQETVHTGPYGALPVLIFSHDPSKSLPKQNPPKSMVDMEDAWNRMQDDLKNLSTRSRRIIAKDSTHYIQIDRTDLLKREVPIFIQQIRGKAAEPAKYGSTITE
jgi:hypothetical protein